MLEIVIEVKDGMVQMVCSKVPLRVRIFDFDNTDSDVREEIQEEFNKAVARTKYRY